MKSPRELKDDQEREFVYSLSSSVNTNMIVDKDYSQNPFINFKIDYFVSHSWSESKVELEGKVKCLQKFAKDSYIFSVSNYCKHIFFNQELDYYPAVWLDKVYINQKEPGFGIAVKKSNLLLKLLYKKK